MKNKSNDAAVSVDSCKTELAKLNLRIRALADDFRKNYVQSAVNAVCDKHNLSFSAGGGVWIFWLRDGECYPDIIDRLLYTVDASKQEYKTRKMLRAAFVRFLREVEEPSKEECEKVVDAAMAVSELREILEEPDPVYHECSIGSCLDAYPEEE